MTQKLFNYPPTLKDYAAKSVRADLHMMMWSYTALGNLEKNQMHQIFEILKTFMAYQDLPPENAALLPSEMMNNILLRIRPDDEE